MQTRPRRPRLTAVGRRRAHTHSVLVTVAFALFWIPVATFAGLADEVAEHEPLAADTVIQGAAHAVRSPDLTNFFLFVTALGEPLVVAGASVIILITLIMKRWYRAAALLIAGVGGALLANLLLKFIFARTRPTEFAAILTEKSYSFPSGHAMVSSAFALVVVFLLWRTRYRAAAIVIGGLATLLIGLSRVYLGVHYPSDVLAGWSVGVIWVVITSSILINRPFALGRRLTGRLHPE